MAIFLIMAYKSTQIYGNIFNNGILKIYIDIWHIHTTHYFCTANLFIAIEISSVLNHDGNY